MRRLNIVHLLRPHWGLLAVAFSAMLVQCAIGLLEPWPLKIIFDYVLGTKHPPGWLASSLVGHDRLAILETAALAVVGIAVIGAVASYTEDYLSTTVAKRVAYDLRRMLYHHVQRLSLSFYTARQTGDMVVRLTSDIDAAESFIGSAVLGMLLDVLTLTGMLAVMAWVAGSFSVFGLLTMPLVFMVVFRYRRRIKAAARAVKRKESELASVVQESITSAPIVQAFAREDYEEQRFDEESRQIFALGLRARSLKARLLPQVEVLVAAGTCAMLWYGVRLVDAGQMTAGALLVCVLYLGKMYKPMKDFSKMSDTLSKASVSFERIAEILSIESDVRDVPGAVAAPPFCGRLEFSHVSFGYAPDQRVLSDLDLVVEAGQHAALVGLTGSGKSTLLGLIPRFYDPSGGSVRIDGRDVRRYTLESLRRQVSLVLQDTALFRASIAENIAYGKPGATREEIARAASLANADEFVQRMPNGYDTVVGERGATLSAGQRQRVAIARAIIRDAPILLLDEPSAALDAESEARVREGLSRLMAGRTSITIAHRLATVMSADVIFVLSGGLITERGTHAELLARGGLYARLFRMQFRDQSVGGAPEPARLVAM